MAAKAFVVALCMIFAGDAQAQARRHAHISTSATRHHAGASNGASPASRESDCPNGDCRGINSPGFMGGNKPF